MRKYTNTDSLHRRLNRVIGQVQALNRMIDNDEIPCEDILSQIHAAKNALHSCGQVLLEGHIKECIAEGIEHKAPEKIMEDFAKSLDRFSNLAS